MNYKKMLMTLILAIFMANALAAEMEKAPAPAKDKTIELMNYIWYEKTDKAMEMIKDNIEINYTNKNGRSVIFYAVIKNYPNILKALIKKGADLNVKDKNGNTALMLAAADGNYDIAKILVTSGADTKLNNKNDRTALQIAEKYQNQDIIKLFNSAPELKKPPVAAITAEKKNKPAEEQKKPVPLKKLQNDIKYIPPDDISAKIDQAPIKKALILIPNEVIKPPIQTPGPEQKMINLNLNQVNITKVLDIFASQGNLNIFADGTASGNVSFSARNIPLMSAFDMILKANGFSWVKTNNTIIVSSRKSSKTIILNFLKAEDARKYVTTIIPTLVGISVDESLNAITLRGDQNDLEESEKIITSIDKKPAQVIVEARVIEVSKGKNPFSAAGIQIKSGDSNQAVVKDFASQPNAATAKGFYAMVMKDDISMWLQALETNSYNDLLANTKIIATNNKPAKIITGQKLGYHVRQFTGTSTIESVEFLTVGTQLEFTPQISKNKYINMIIKPKVSEGQITDSLPQENTTEVQTQLTVKDGQSIVIGGLIRDKKVTTHYGIPILMDIPFIGGLFQSTDKRNEQKETIIIITPHIVDDEGTSEIITGNVRGE